MQLELGGLAAAPTPSGPRVLALWFPELPLQRLLRAREALGAGRPGARPPLAVAREGRVVACEAEARASGVRPGDSLVQARAACGDLDAVAFDEAADRAALEGIAEALLALAPAVEVAPPDVLLLDASGAHLLGEGAAGERALLEQAVASAAQLGLRARAGLATGRGPARALARHGRGSPIVASAAGALAPLPLGALELPDAFGGRLAALGLRFVGELARLPVEALLHRFGAPGLAAWRLAHGDDPSPLAPYVPTRFPEERLELEAPVESAEPLLFGLKRLSDRLAARLAGRGLGATRLTLVLRLEPDGEERVDLALALPTAAASRWLLVMRERLGALRLPGAVTAVTLAVAEAAAAPREQFALGDRPEQLAALETVLTRLAARLGGDALFAARSVDRHRPEGAYAPAAFACGKRTASSSSSTTSTSTEGIPPASALSRPTRLLARPEPLLALGEGGRLTAVRASGRTLRVLALSPAERLAGEWWSEPFDRDYHRAHLEGLGECWIFRDAADGRLWLHGFFD
jgi:protein ImuB